MFDPEKHDKLPNGALILHRKKVSDIWIWLAELGGYMPYVTWVSHESTPGGTCHGHYHSRFGDAYMDFIERIGRYRSLIG